MLAKDTLQMSYIDNLYDNRERRVIQRLAEDYDINRKVLDFLDIATMCKDNNDVSWLKDEIDSFEKSLTYNNLSNGIQRLLLEDFEEYLKHNQTKGK